MGGQSMTLRRLLRASAEEVFDAWLDADGMSAWMCPGLVTNCEVTLEPHVGGHFHIVMKAPGIELRNTGEFLVLERPAKLQFTWISSRWGHEETLVTIDLHQRESQCELVLTHERFPKERSLEELEKGWNQIVQKLGNFLATASDRPENSR